MFQLDISSPSRVRLLPVAFIRRRHAADNGDRILRDLRTSVASANVTNEETNKKGSPR